MDDVSRHGSPAGPHVARRAVTLAMAACLLASCSTQEGSDSESSPSRPASESRTAPPREAADRSAPATGHSATDRAVPKPPTVPARRSASALAGQLDRATAILGDRDAAATDVRRAGRFQQLAVHALATGPGAFRRKVLARLDAGTARVNRGAVRAARSLHVINSPQQTLPSWRIVAPPKPAKLVGYYRRAQRRTGVPWTYLAAINLVETRMGRIRGTSTAGARGPMQFIPATWEVYGGDGDIKDPRDAILAAARLLKDHGAPGDMAEALWHYNPSDNYVRAVTEHARTMQRSRAAYRGYWHWRVLYRHERGTYVLPVGYPDERPVLLHRG